MDEGKVIMEDVPKKVFSKVKEIKRLGLDVPQVTELAYTLNKEGFDVSVPLVYDIYYLIKT